MKISPHGQRRWTEIEAALPDLLASLCNAESAPRLQHKTAIPQEPGVYLFAERGRAIYVGQTRNLRRRLADHCRISGGHNKASFAFLLAKENFEEEHGEHSGTRAQMESAKGFKAEFDAAKARVETMPVRFITCQDPEMRTVFEVYAAEHLGTKKYNSFETH